MVKHSAKSQQRQQFKSGGSRMEGVGTRCKDFFNKSMSKQLHLQLTTNGTRHCFGNKHIINTT
jgi:hypothetical protein